jgi:hypothetical protein
VVESRERLEIQRQINEALEKGSDITKAFGQVLQANLDRVRTLNEIAEATSNDIGLQEQSSKLSNIAKDAEKELAKIKQQQFDIEKQFGQIDDKRVKSARALSSEAGGLEDKAQELETIISIAKAESERVDAAKELTDLQQEQAKAAMSAFTSIIGNIKKLPAGGIFLSAIGLGEGNLKKIGENFNKYLTGEVKGFGKVFQIAGKDGTKFLGKMAIGAIGIGASIGIAVGLFKGLLKIGRAFAATADSLGKSFGRFGTDLNNAVVQNLRMGRREAQSLGFSIEDLSSTTSVLASEFGVGLEQASQLSKSVLNVARATGLSADESAKFFGTLVGIAGLSQLQAEEAAKTTFNLAEQNNVNPAVVMKDMADSASTIAKFGADNLGSITKAAIQARKFGLNLKTVEGIADSLLDFQTSLNSEIEASLITGKDINLQKARELALTGKIDDMMSEVLKQVGGEAEFNKMNVFQRQSLAKALGRSVEELDKLVSAQDDTVTKSKTFTELLGKDGLSALTALTNELKALGVVFIDRVGPKIMDMAKKLKGFLETEEGMNRMVAFAENLGDMVIKIVQNMDVVLGALGALMGASIGFMFGGPVGAAVGMLIGGTGGFLAGQGLAVPTGGVGGADIISPDGVIAAQGGISRISSARAGGNTGPSSREMEMAFSNAVKPLIDDNRKLREQNDTLIATTNRQADRIGEVIGDFS